MTTFLLDKSVSPSEWAPSAVKPEGENYNNFVVVLYTRAIKIYIVCILILRILYTIGGIMWQTCVKTFVSFNPVEFECFYFLFFFARAIRPVSFCSGREHVPSPAESCFSSHTILATEKIPPLRVGFLLWYLYDVSVVYSALLHKSNIFARYTR